MDRGPVSMHTCDSAVSLAFTILGKRWNGMIVDALSAGPLSFAALRRSVEGISDAVLSDRLTELAEALLLTRVVEPGPPISVAYTLTPSGEQLVPLLRQLGQWATAHLPQSEEQPER
ncbi:MULTISPECIES: winged helix-turn-helix transcriptional regulator [unclassified Arthrobacter]|uniref:winged helix-turn-helix transcriptional regulator n=1 Tax=unclassified Arthrobacter TaxID=235627 RepID=UPI001D14652B|nr:MULTISPECIES: helix-turn-helix domain-containing protein [unclassified Arthrobacter]MCC3279933.1 helix-turn-helix transcriptional regulator [Arthrobacter sp. zg-Y40]MCC9178315.1 helix-turn-helix transcriptional regulator [Arthrobacter sp. zg-Y750]